MDLTKLPKNFPISMIVTKTAKRALNKIGFRFFLRKTLTCCISTLTLPIKPRKKLSQSTEPQSEASSVKIMQCKIAELSSEVGKNRENAQVRSRSKVRHFLALQLEAQTQTHMLPIEKMYLEQAVEKPHEIKMVLK